MIRASAFVMIFILFGAGAAAACDGMQGKSVFEDDFSDDSGGWYLIKDYVDLKDKTLIIRPNLGAKDTTLVKTSTINTFSQTDGEYCADFVMAKFSDGDNNLSAGVEFWEKDYNNLYNFTVFSNKTAGLYRMSGGNWTTIYQDLNVASVKNDGSVNSLRVVAKAGKLAMSINGTPFKTIRAQAPDGDSHFGVYVGVNKPTDVDTTVTFKNFAVTAGQ